MEVGFVGSAGISAVNRRVASCRSELYGRPLAVAGGVVVVPQKDQPRRGGVQMNIISRLFRVFRANANKSVSDLEDPETIIKQSLQEMERDLGKVRNSYAETKASLRKYERDAEKIEEAVGEWTRRAELSLQKGDEALAREALQRKKEKQMELARANEQVKMLRDAEAKFQDTLTKYANRIEEAKGEAVQYTSRSAAAKALKKVNEMNTGVGEGAAATFGQMKEKVEAMEINADLTADALPAAENPELNAKFRALESDDVEDELKKMKGRLLKGSD
mmetsp:Transcript_140/g.427  ORF Transcript_140/g.427 Transcript_140/m.427 type:complete len:276 (+) Transcript_140:160-987(+)|eukprot:CAMPEP_0198727698 /NCGR_PEP_ID=MMETSP1475-20131203/4859_1 /TAXON_ID= ORGANISM="Unidentified sp., Strain CCMP1999" /NCGR_SAMPLE_ID=MMETSP1475 /ASSEMBLY_ACC=CAM_ASM_001111 /LENGTH=275 /DNA_ID=CAMNT_0044489809 /DNA_START=152 /DNA_END=979 /DNA_ORIENTATION=+